MLKKNTDDSFQEKTNSGGWGFIVRNETGEAVAAGHGAYAGNC
jgi:hypothetical protein